MSHFDPIGPSELTQLKDRLCRIISAAMTDLNYHHLLYFWTVAREGSVSRASQVLKLAQRCLASPAVVAAVSADQVIRELPFTVQSPDGTGFVTGRIDLLYRVGDDWTVVDYKTDTVEDGELTAAGQSHAAQVSAYVEAVHAVVGREPRVVLVFARVGVEVGFGASVTN